MYSFTGRGKISKAYDGSFWMNSMKHRSIERGAKAGLRRFMAAWSFLNHKLSYFFQLGHITLCLMVYLVKSFLAISGGARAASSHSSNAAENRRSLRRDEPLSFYLKMPRYFHLLL